LTAAFTIFDLCAWYLAI